jgi:hypothetical protein
MHRRQIKVEHPSQPDILVVIGLLFRVVMSNSEIVGNVEQIRLVLAGENPLPFRSHVMSFAASLMRTLIRSVRQSWDRLWWRVVPE